MYIVNHFLHNFVAQICQFANNWNCPLTFWFFTYPNECKIEWSIVFKKGIDLSPDYASQLKRSFSEIPTRFLTPYREFEQRPYTPQWRQLDSNSRYGVKKYFHVTSTLVFRGISTIVVHWNICKLWISRLVKKIVTLPFSLTYLTSRKSDINYIPSKKTWN
jgi:hypothetical protein